MRKCQAFFFLLYLHSSAVLLHGNPPGGYVIQWGWDSVRAKPIPPMVVLSNAVAISAGMFHSLALRADGVVCGWGGEVNGAVLGSALAHPVVTNGLVRVNGQVLSNVVSVVAARNFSLALKQDGTVLTWGQTYVPNGISNIAAIAADETHSWVLDRGGRVIGWSSSQRPEASQGMLNAGDISNVTAIAVGPGEHTRGVALLGDSSVRIWGIFPELPASAVPPAGLSRVVAVAAGKNHSLALNSDGFVVGWGWNKVGAATGIPTTNTPNGFDLISSGQVRLGGELLNNVVSIAANDNYSLALKRDGTMVAWGRMINDLYPVTIPPGLSNVVAIAAGYDFCLAITTNRAVVDRFRK